MSLMSRGNNEGGLSTSMVDTSTIQVHIKLILIKNYLAWEKTIPQIKINSFSHVI